LVISAEAMPETPAAARKTQRLARKFHDVLLLGITGLIVRYADPYGSRGRKVSRCALKSFKVCLAAKKFQPAARRESGYGGLMLETWEAAIKFVAAHAPQHQEAIDISRNIRLGLTARPSFGKKVPACPARGRHFKAANSVFT
jgi:hypothetical protein